MVINGWRSSALWVHMDYVHNYVEGQQPNCLNSSAVIIQLSIFNFQLKKVV